MKTKSLQIGKAMSAALFVLLLIVIEIGQGYAQTVQHINYGITSTDPREVIIIGHDGYYNNMLSISFPSSVLINGKTYTVVGINSSAFSNTTVRQASYPSTFSQISGFSNSGNIQSITVNSNLDFSIGGFSNCNNLTSINIRHSNHLTSILGSAFAGCSGLSSFSVPQNVTMIYNSAFRNCSAMHSLSYNAKNCTSVIAPLTPSTFNPDAHWLKNTPIHSLSIGAQVQSIPDYAFYGCSQITSITVNAVNPPDLGTYVFYNVNKNIPVTVPCGSVNAYRNAAGWSEFTNILDSSYAISVDAIPSEGGSVAGEGVYCSGTNCTLIATANSGYTFTCWKENGNVVSTNANYSFTVTGNRNLVAIFSLNSYSINAIANPSAGGTITGGDTYAHGTTCTLVATSNNGYTFINWTENGNVVSTSASYSFTVTGARNLVANFSLNTYTVSVALNPVTGGTVSGMGTYNYGDTVTLNAIANEGYTFVNWTENGMIISSTINYSFEVTGDRSLVANFNPNNYTVFVSLNLANAGIVDGCGTYAYGTICTLTATANEEYVFVNWTENGMVASSDTMYSFTITGNRTLVANYSYVGIDGMLRGVFSVGNNTKARFSQGNLQYQASTNTWRFANNQYDHIGEGNAGISQNYDGWIDLFGWGTSGWNNGNTCYHPWDTNTEGDGTLFGPPGFNSLDGENVNADWGVYNSIINGGNQPNLWRTLSYWEWNYLLNTRTTFSGVRYAKAQVNNVNGLILVPDNWRSSIYELQNVNVSESPFDSNVISLTMWINTFESNGAVFLPAAGARYYGTSLFYLNDCGHYWSSTCHGNLDNYAIDWGFSDEWVNYYAGNRSTGLSVRLVRILQDTSTCIINALSLPASGGTIIGSGVFNVGEICTLVANTNVGYSFVNWTKDGVEVSTDAIYSFTVIEDAEYVANFNPAGFHFTTLGNWSQASNWQGGTLPSINDEVFIETPCQLDINVTVSALTVSEGQSLTLQSGKSLIVSGELVNTEISGLVIEDGAQLINATSNVAATMEKGIAAYPSSGPDGWYTIASPMDEMPIAESDFLTPNFDLYRFDETNLTHEEWQNYKANHPDFATFEKGRGYLYANSNSFAPAFMGTLSNTAVTYHLTYTERPDALSGFNLIGNPFPHVIYKGAGGAIDNAQLASGYYTLTNEGAWHVHTYEDAIMPGQGILVKTMAGLDLTIAKSNATALSESSDAKASSSRVVLKVSGSWGEDRAFVYFGQGIGLDKMENLSRSVPSLWIRDNGHDYAIAHVDSDCESLELFFSNMQSGDFTLSVDVSDTSFSVLQLTDRISGVTIDLLQQPSYVFHSAGQENEARFSLTFKMETMR